MPVCEAFEAELTKMAALQLATACDRAKAKWAPSATF
jgi:hypothetical protein